MGMVVIQPYISVKKAKENQDKVPTLNWLPKLHKTPIKQDLLLILVLVQLSKFLTPCLTAVKNKYCEKVYQRFGKNLFWSI